MKAEAESSSDKARRIQEEIARALAERIRRLRTDKLFQMFPDEGPLRRELYPKHIEFFNLGVSKPVRAFFGGNGTGKSEAELFEICCHARGWYPEWWEGARFNRPLEIWVAGKTRDTTRDIQQTKLLGNPYEEGTGILPSAWIDPSSIKRISNTAGAIDNFKVLREDGYTSRISFKSFDQGVASFFGTERDVVAVDELCPLAVFTQCVARTRNREGAQVLFTATPMEGRTETVRMFLESTDAQMAYVTCGWKDAPHLSEDWKAKQRAVTPDYLIDAVEFGVPGRGAGAVYPVPEKEFVIDPITIPRDWMWIYGLDTGYHNTAAAWFAFDPTGDVAYLVADYKDGGGKLDVSVHASRVLSRCRGFGFENMPGVGDAAARDQSDGAQILKQYHMAGCKQLRLANKEVGSVNAGVSAFLERLQTGRLKVFRTCDKFLDEFRNYQYTTPDEKSAPRIVKTNDHILDAARYVIWGGLKFARKRSNLTVVPRMAEQTFGIYG